jgi:WD40 repeat protein
MAEQMQPVQRKVALKIIKAGMDSRHVLARFEAERQALALMDHPNIATVLDAGATAEGRPFFVMELVKGQTLTRYSDEHRLTPRERLELFVPVCRAIQHAHQKGIIHRDIKPSNVLVAPYDGKPVVKVIDFGVAKATRSKLTDKTLFTEFGAVVGTLEYMSPEQAELNNQDIDTRSDIYSLGVLLYELLTGTTPLDRKRLKEAAFTELLRMIREEEPPKPSTRVTTLGQAATTISGHRKSDPKRLSKVLRGELDWIVMMALEKDRNRRYESASAFGADVQRYLTDEPVQACPRSAWYGFRKFARRNRGALTTGALLTAALVLAVVALAVSNVWVSRERDEKGKALQNESAALTLAKEQEGRAKIQQALAEAEAKRAGEQEKTARRRFYAAQMNLAYQAREAGDAARVLELLESQRPAVGGEDLRGFEWYHLWRRCHSGRRWAVHEEGGTVVAFSPDGKTLASGTADATVKFWDVASGQVRTTLRGLGGRVSAVAFSPDGKTLAAGIDGDVWLWDVATAHKRGRLQSQVQLWSLAFTPDGKRLACGHTCCAGLWDLETGRLEATLPMHEGQFEVVTVAFSPDGKTLACCGSNSDPMGSIRLWDVATRRERLTLAASGVMAYCSDSKTLAAGGLWDPVQLLDLATGKPWPKRWKSTFATALAFSPDGQTLAVASTKRSVLLWDLKTGKERILQAHASRILSLAFSPDSKLLASASEYGTIELWQLTPVHEPVKLQEPQPGAVPHVSAAFSPDGTIVAVGGKLWETATRKQMRCFLESGKVAFSPDGKVLAWSTNDNAIIVCDIATGKKLASLATGFLINPVAFSPDGTKLAAGGSGGVLAFWDTATWQERGRIPMATTWLCALAFSPDGKMLAAGFQEGHVQLFDANSGQQRLALRGARQRISLDGLAIWSLAFSADGGLLATGDALGHAKLWDAHTGELRVSFNGHSDGVASLAFSPGGKTVITGSHDGTVKIWDVATGQERATLKGHPDRVESVAIAPDGNTLVAAGNDGSVLVWYAATDAEARASRRVELGRPERR